MKINFEENLQNALLKFGINFQKLDEQKDVIFVMLLLIVHTATNIKI